MDGTGTLTRDPVTGNQGNQADVQGKGDSSFLTGQIESSAKPAESTTSVKGAPEPSAQDSAPQKPAWVAQLPKDLQSDETTTRFKTFGDVWKAYREIEGKVTNGVEVPGEKAPAEEREAFFKKLGRPDTMDGYQLEKTELPKGLAYSPELENGFKEAAFNLGLSNEQAKNLYSWYNQSIVAQHEQRQAAQQKQYQDTETALKKEWGPAFQENVVLMTRAMKQFSTPELTRIMSESGLGNHPDVIKLFVKVGQAIAEDRIVDASKIDRMSGAKSYADILYPGS